MENFRKLGANSRLGNTADLHHQRLATTGATTGRAVAAPPTPVRPSFGPVLDLKQAAELLQCHPKTLRLMAQAGKVPAQRLGKLWRFSARRLREWLEAS